MILIRLLSNTSNGIRFINGKVGNDARFYCHKCWRQYLNCKDLIPYFWSKSPFNTTQNDNNDDNDIDI